MSKADSLSKQFETLVRSVRSAAEAFAAQAEAAQEGAARLLGPLDRLLEFQRALEEKTGPVLEAMREHWEALLTWQEAWESLPQRIRVALEVLAAHGWYIDDWFGLSGLFDTAESFATSGPEAANQALCHHYEGRMDALEEHLCQRFSHRDRLIRAAFRAHRGGDYALSVPVLLMQADGICWELSQERLYGKRKGVPKLAKKLRARASGSTPEYGFHPLVVVTPMTADTDQLGSLQGILNRHAVLHGLDTAYDSRLNSCRALSLLSYVAWVLDSGEAGAEGH